MTPSGRRIVRSLVALSAVAVLWKVASDPWPVSDQPVTFGLLAALVLAGELLLVRIPGSVGFEDDLTVSAAFALALVLLFGAAPGVAVYAGACLIAEAVRRVSADK